MTTPPSPTPGPRPGPRPGVTPGAMPGATPAPRPSAVARPAAPHAVHIPKSDPSRFGRIDEDGTVVLITKAGERVIGSWQAGSPEAGLAHYAQRFADLATEVELLEARLKAHPDDAANIRTSAAALRESLPEATVIGDVDNLDDRLAEIMNESVEAGEEAKQRKAERRAQAIARKEELAAEAESIAADSTEWKAAGDRLRAILDEWKTIRGIDRATDDALWKRYSKARDSFNRRRGSHFAELDRNRAAARRTKEALVAKAEELKDSTDWNATAGEFRELMKQWKAAGRAPREVDNALWASFKAAQDHFFQARNALNEQRDKEFQANAEAKDELIAEYTPLITPEKDLEAARTKLHELQEKWEAIGYVPRAKIREYDSKIKQLEDKVARAADEQWRRTDPEVQARAQQFLDRVDEFNHQAAEAEKAGKTKDAEKYRAQAAQWQEWADAATQAVDNL
ncbi:DUF349 domain-containing protein [Corynebacterium sp. 11A]|uniref:DUF349 domain-containing protein n=1 Tax=Corynebacterium sp. 11A TaxID=2080510 RepID=UPI00124ED956|nr:DUF349 domain-containing protein [Corynebacterium sp. 11A]